MLPTERKQQILALLRERREISVQALAEELEVTAASVRRDLRDLEAENRISRRHGKAIYRPMLVAQPPVQEPELDESLVEALVAEALAVLLETRCVFLGGGPVLTRVAAQLSGKTILTHDLTLAMAAAKGGNDVALLGRELDNSSLTLKPHDPEAELADYWFDASLVEAEGLDSRGVFVSRSQHAILRAVRRRSDSLVVLGKSSLVGQRSERMAAPLSEVDLLLVDAGISDESAAELERAGVELRKAAADEGEGINVGNMTRVYMFKRMDDSPFGARKREEPGS